MENFPKKTAQIEPASPESPNIKEKIIELGSDAAFLTYFRDKEGNIYFSKGSGFFENTVLGNKNSLFFTISFREHFGAKKRCGSNFKSIDQFISTGWH